MVPKPKRVPRQPLPAKAKPPLGGPSPPPAARSVSGPDREPKQPQHANHGRGTLSPTGMDQDPIE